MDEIFNERGKVVKFVFSIIIAIITILPSSITFLNLNTISGGEMFITILSLIFVIPLAGFLGFISAKHLIQKVANNSPITGIVFKDGILIGGLCGALANIPLYVATITPLLIFAVPIGFFIGAIAGTIGAAIAFNIARVYLRGGQNNFSQ